MSYKIEKAGYRFKGYELGQKVMHKGKETTIIGFDTDGVDDFIAVKSSWIDAFDLRESIFARIVLDTAHNENYKAHWAKESEITPIKEKERGMNFSDVKVGMKVVPFRKTAGVGKNLKSYLSWCDDKQSNFFTQNGFLYICGIREKGEVVLWYNKDEDTGDYFNPSDFELFEEKEIMTMRNGDKLTLRDDLIVGKYYGGLKYLDSMVKPNSNVTFRAYRGEGSDSIKIYECDSDFNYSPSMFKNITQNKVKSDEIKQDKKSKVSDIRTKLHVDLLFDKPVIEETKEDVYIFSGRTTIYFSKEMGCYGIATCHSNELSSYNKEVGMSLAYRRSHLSLNKKRS